MAGGLMVPSLMRTSANLMARSYATCDTQACKNAAASILHDLDLNADPCDDFYQYTCGNWIRDSKIPDTESSVGTFANLRNDNYDQLSNMLNSDYDKIIESIKTNSTDFLTSSGIDRDNFNKMKDYYSSCMNEDAIDSLGPTPMFSDIAKLMKTFPVTNGFRVFNVNEDMRSLTDVLIHLEGNDVGHLVSFGIGSDDLSPKENAVTAYQPGFGMPSRDYYEQPDALSTYRNGLVRIISHVFGDKEDNKLRLEKLKEINFTPLSDTQVEIIVDQFVEFETHLAKITLPKEQLRDPIKTYNPMTIQELNQKYPLVDWTRFFRHFTPNDAEVPSKIIIKSPEYMQALTQWFTNSDIENGVTIDHLYSYFLIKSTLANIRHLDRPTRNIYHEMDSKISSGTSAPPLRSRTCIGFTSGRFGQLLGRYFVLNRFGESQRHQTLELMDQIQNSWQELLEEIDWIDTETKSKALDKVKKISHKAAYSTVRPDIRSPESLRDYYFKEVQINPNDFYANQKSTSDWGNRQEWAKIGKPVDREKWEMDPHTVNAYYTSNGNEIVIPAGILQPPFYDAEIPYYLNYGGIGVVIGHEITHAFDNSGRLFDGEGVLNNWWNNQTSEAFDAKSQCFVNRVNGFSVEGPNNTTHPVNGKLTLGENLADNGGINAAFKALKKSLVNDPGKNKRLPDLEDLSPEQLFFINYGRVWCSNMRPEMAVQRVRSDVHAPSKVRVNGAVQNSLEFSRAFKCKPKDKMNPVDKCQIW